MVKRPHRDQHPCPHLHLRHTGHRTKGPGVEEVTEGDMEDAVEDEAGKDIKDDNPAHLGLKADAKNSRDTFTTSETPNKPMRTRRPHERSLNT